MIRRSYVVNSYDHVLGTTRFERSHSRKSARPSGRGLAGNEGFDTNPNRRGASSAAKRPYLSYRRSLVTPPRSISIPTILL